MQLAIKRVYEQPEKSDGYRVLVDRLWPRGLTKQAASLDLWAKEAAPSPELRRSWHADPEAHTPEHFAEFAAAYRDELIRSPAREALERLAALAREHDRLTLLYGARDTGVNHAVVLRDVLLEALGRDA